MSITEKKLNKSQQEAVEYTNGPLLIVAGAGTGKTTVITEKIAYLIENKLAKPEEILALTFTDKTAEEMQARVDEMIDVGYADMQISTFHSFCEHLLQRHGIDIGISNLFKVVTDTGAWLLLLDQLYNFNLDYYRPLGNPTKHIHELLKHFSKCKDELITPEDYLKYALEIQSNSNDDVEEKKRITEISEAYQKYNQLLLDSNTLDFGDLVFYTVKLLQKRSNIKKQLQDRFKYILVDEFQDVNWAQYVLVKLLAERGQLTVVGDDDQSIYAFRGASVSNILRFKDDFPLTKEVVLNENYRSGQEILDVAYKAIQNNNPDRLEVKLKIDKKLKSGIPGLKSEVMHLHSDSIDEEVRTVLDRIVKLKNEAPESEWSDFAILVRANSQAEPFVNALEKAHIPFEFLSATGLFRQPVVLDCFNFLKVVDHYHESNAVFRLLRIPFLNFSDQDLILFTATAKRKSVSYYDGLACAQEWGVSESGVVICEKIKEIIEAGTLQSRAEKTSSILYSFLESIGYLAYLTHEENVGNRKVIHQIHQLREFFDFIAEFESTSLDFHVSHFINYFTSMIDSGDEGEMAKPDYAQNALNILSVHKSKGLEFKYVFLVNLVEERFPSRSRGDAIEIPVALIHEQLPEGNIHYQEERRLFYVGITRAKERLFLTSADYYGGVKKRKLSRFLVEAGLCEEVVKVKKSKKSQPETDQSLFEKSNRTIKQLLVRSESSVEGSNEAENNKSIIEHIPTSFSFSQIKAYEACPYQYKLVHILRMPIRGSATFSFGKSMHLTLQKFYTRIQEMNSIGQTSLDKVTAPDKEELLKLYEESWIGDWYRNKRQREEYFQKGREILVNFYNLNKDNWTVPVVLEGSFKIKIGEDTIRGQIDRIDQLADKSLEIIDYKTGKSHEKIKGEDKPQLLLYQMAVQNLPEYSHLGVPGKLTYIYLNDNIQSSFVGTLDDLDDLRDDISKTIDEIKSGNFSATPNKFVCGYCDFKDICEFRIL